MGSITVLVEGARLGVDKAEIPKTRKKVRPADTLAKGESIQANLKSHTSSRPVPSDER
jgi:hypothetical protein